MMSVTSHILFEKGVNERNGDVSPHPIYYTSDAYDNNNNNKILSHTD